MAKTARRSVESNPSSLTTSAAFPFNYSSASSTGSGNHQKPIQSIVPLTSLSLTSSISLSPSSVSASSAVGSAASTSPFLSSFAVQSASPSSAVSSDPLRTSNNHQPATRTVNNHDRNDRNLSVPTDRPFSFNNSDNGSYEHVDNNANYTKEYNSTRQAKIQAAERERIRAEFFATYDYMTGVRIAATLGAFFALMVFLIVYKSRSNSKETLKVLKDPKIAAVAAACMQEEEDREIQEAMDATGMSIFPDEYDTMNFRRQRMLSLGNVSAPPVLHRGFRFSSVGGGGYSSLLEPPRRYSYSGGRRKSAASLSSRAFSSCRMGGSLGTDDYFVETDDELENEFDRISTQRGETTKNTLEVPGNGQESRRSSGMTCCSTESSYLERRCSAITLGLSSKIPPSVSRRSSTDLWDYYYPDIQVIQPTPKTSPCPSERSLNDKSKRANRNDSLKNKRQERAKLLIKQKSDGSNFETEANTTADYRFARRSVSVIEDENGQKSMRGMSGRRHSRRNSRVDERRESFAKRYPNDSADSNRGSISQSAYTDYQRNCDHTKRAPLASLSSFKISSIDYQDSDLKSLGSDSVFIESYADTDDDMEQFSTDSEDVVASIAGKRYIKSAAQVHSSYKDKSQNSLNKPSSSTSSYETRKLSLLGQNQNQSSIINKPLLQRHHSISVPSRNVNRCPSFSEQTHYDVSSQWSEPIEPISHESNVLSLSLIQHAGTSSENHEPNQNYGHNHSFSHPSFDETILSINRNDVGQRSLKEKRLYSRPGRNQNQLSLLAQKFQFGQQRQEIGHRNYSGQDTGGIAAIMTITTASDTASAEACIIDATPIPTIVDFDGTTSLQRDRITFPQDNQSNRIVQTPQSSKHWQFPNLKPQQQEQPTLNIKTAGTSFNYDNNNISCRRLINDGDESARHRHSSVTSGNSMKIDDKKVKSKLVNNSDSDYIIISDNIEDNIVQYIIDDDSCKNRTFEIFDSRRIISPTGSGIGRDVEDGAVGGTNANNIDKKSNDDDDVVRINVDVDIDIDVAVDNHSNNRNHNYTDDNHDSIDNRQTVISPSVILELPVISLPSQDEDPPRDPSLPGTSRKWSKETLF